LSARLASHLATLLKNKGINVDPEVDLRAHLVSHLGRRSWEESKMYPEDVSNSADKSSKTNEVLGVEILEAQNLEQQTVTNTVKGLAR